MEELTAVRQNLMKQWDMFSKLGGEWNDGYFQAIREAVNIVDDAIRNIKMASSNNENRSINDGWHPSYGSFENIRGKNKGR